MLHKERLGKTFSITMRENLSLLLKNRMWWVPTHY